MIYVIVIFNFFQTIMKWGTMFLVLLVSLGIMLQQTDAETAGKVNASPHTFTEEEKEAKEKKEKQNPHGFDGSRCNVLYSFTTPLHSPNGRQIVCGSGCTKAFGHQASADWGWGTLDTLRPRQNCRHFADDSFLNENVWIWLMISLKFLPNVRINNIPAWVQIMAWRRSGDEPLSEPMMVN